VNQELLQVSQGVLATSRAVMQVEVADVVVFDVDGVIIDVHHSYPHVICQASDTFLREIGFTGEASPVTPEETTYFKAAGGFNSDWNLAQGIVLCYLVKALAIGSRDLNGLGAASPDLETIARSAGEYGGGLTGLSQGLQNLLEVRDWQVVEGEWDRARITRLCQEHYAGDLTESVFGVANSTIKGPGLMTWEKPMLSRTVLEAAGLRYGIYTGRNYGETEKAMELAGLDGFFERRAMITETEGLKKPNPEGLFRIANALKPRLMIFCGDNLDDWQTASRYEAERSLDQPPCLFCGVLDGSPGPLAYGLFQDRGVDLMAKSANQLVTWVVERRKILTID
jgi:HAD superfamily hydrolase (TIGR01548 family)